MSWLKDLTAKAENMLTQIDENAASIFNNKIVTEQENDFSKLHVEIDDCNSIKPNYGPISNGASLKLKKKTDLSELDFNTHSSAEYQKFSAQIEQPVKREDTGVHTEMLQNEIHSLNHELSLLLHRTKLSKEETSRVISELESYKYENEILRLQLAELSRNANNKIVLNDQLNGIDALSGSLQDSSENSAHLSDINVILRKNKQLEHLLKEKEEKLKEHTDWAPIAAQNEIESLNKSLVDKQSDLELLAASQKALQFRFDLLQKKYYDALSIKTPSAALNINDTDDAKAQVPSFFRETPFDTGVARRVKKAYSCIDSLSIKAGMFLRRYPLFRISMLFYVVLLHVWVLLVLFSYMPDTKE